MTDKSLAAETAALPPTVPAHAHIAGFKIEYRLYALLLLTAVYLVNYVDRQIIAILLPQIKAHFEVSDTLLGLLSGLAFGLFYATLGIPIAYLADRYSRKHIITISLALFSVMTVLCGAAVSFWQLFLARMGVGVGEAGTSPPSHSIISDFYRPEERGTALGIFAAGLNLGIMVGFFAGGQIAEHFGWRVAFFAAGIPGLLLAILVHFSLREPPRGHVEARSHQASDAPPLKAVGATLLGQAAFLHLAFGAGLNALVGYGSVQWTPAFLVRSHEMAIGDVGLLLAFMWGVFGGIGSFLGGYFADRLGRRDVSWYMLVPAIAVIGAAPAGLVFYLADSLTIAVIAMVLPAMVGAIYLAPCLAMTQGLVPLAMRATAAAIFLFVTNIIGLGLGPLVIGMLSDWLQPSLGNESLRYALVIVGVVNLWSALHFYLASRSLKADLARIA